MKPSMLIALLLAAGAVALPLQAGAQTCPPGLPRVAPDSRYIDHGNGTVTDRQTGLMWKRCSEGQSGLSCSGSATTMNWEAALQAAASSSFAGHGDWRLPNVKEMQSLVETGCHSPVINTTFFPNTPYISSSQHFWTSTTSAVRSDLAWKVGFGEGTFTTFGKHQDSGVRLVRAGR